MKNLIIILLLSVGVVTSNAQDSTYYVGHSLINLDVPYQTMQLLELNNVPNYYKHHINIGAGLKMNWTDSAFNSNPMWDFEINVNIDRGTNHFVELQNAYHHMVVTEAVPLLNYERDSTVKYASNFFNLGQASSPNMKKFLFATWEGDAADGLLWRDQVASLVPEWEAIADQCALETGGDVFIVPGNLAMLALYDTLQSRSIGSFNAITDFFSPDGIHLNHNGNYLIACLMAAVLRESNSEGLTYVEAGPYTIDSAIIDPIARAVIQKLAKDVVCAYSRTGVSNVFCGATVVDTFYQLSVTQTLDTTFIRDNSIAEDSVYANDTTFSSIQYFQNDTIFQNDSIHINYYYLQADTQATALNSLSFSPGVKVFPNPFIDKLFLSFDSEDGANVIVEIFNIIGKNMFQVELECKIGSNKIEIPQMLTLEKGVYLMRINAGIEQLDCKVIKYK